MTHVGTISYFEIYHDEEDGVLRAHTNRDDFSTEFDVPDSFNGNISSVRDQLYPELVSEYNDWQLER